MNPHHMYPPGPGQGAGPGPGGPQNFHNVPPRPHSHGQPPVNQPVAVYGHQLEQQGQAPPSQMQGGPPPPPPPSGGMIQPLPPPQAPPFGGMNMIPFQSSVPVQNVNGQPGGMNFSGQQQVQNMGPSMKDAFQTTMDPSLMPQAPPPSQGVQANNPSGQFIAVTTSEFPKYGIGHHIYTGKIPEMPADIPGGQAGMQTMLLPSVSNTQNLDGGSRQQVRLGMVPNPSDSIFGIHISQFGGLNAAQIENMEVSGAGAGAGGKLSSSHSIEEFSLHHESSNSLGGGGGGGGGSANGGNIGGETIVTPSTSYIVMASGVFPATGGESINSNPTTFSGSTREGGGTSGGGVVPIGTERAQKATLSAFPITSGK